MPHHSASPPFPNVTLAMLSWRAPATVAHTLASYQSANILDLFAKNHLHFNEMTEQDQTIGAQFQFTVTGTPDNLGIFGGVDALASATTTPFILVVENDCPLDTDRAGLIAMVHSALADMIELNVPAFMMRSRINPGEPFWRRARYEERFAVLRPLGCACDHPAKSVPLLQRVYENRRRPALRGSAIYAEADPTLRHPGVIKRSHHGNWITRSTYLQWSNCCFLAKTDFLRDVILNHVRHNPSKTCLNGHQDIEAALKDGRFWRRLNVPIGQSEPGPFTHQRLDR
jgi:hypothetical protein